VHDWPGYHHIIAGDLADTFIHHATELGVEMIGSRKVVDLQSEGEDLVIVARDVVTSEEHRHPAHAVIVAIGGGAFEPRKLKVPGEETLDESVLTYRMPDKSRVAGKRVVVVGGGDSGLESAQSAHQAGAHVTMLQVLDRFTGMESNIDLVNQMEIARHFSTRVKSLEIEGGGLRAVVAQTKGAPEPLRIETDYLVVNIGAAVNLDAVRSWGIDTEGNQIKVDGNMKTSRAGVFACGDIVVYEGKYKLLLTASSEGCVAANSAYVHVKKPQRVTMGELYT
jgi:thioredoxin reductase (NADPH)